MELSDKSISNFGFSLKVYVPFFMVKA